MKKSQQEKLVYQRMCKKQMLHNVRSRQKKRTFRRLMQGVPRRKVGYFHLRRYSSPNQFLIEQQIQSHYRDYYHVQAPSVLSLVKNREEVIRFINEIKAHFERKHKVFVVLSNVVTLTDDAIVVLLSLMIRFQERHIDFNGNYPKSKDAVEKLEKSGFFDYLYKNGADALSVKSMNSSI